MSLSRRMTILQQTEQELARQDLEFGEQNHEFGTGGGILSYSFKELASAWKTYNDHPNIPDRWTGIFLEEVFEALAEEDPEELRKELIQAAAVALQWVEAIDRRQDRVDDASASVKLDGLTPSEETEARLRRGEDPDRVYQDILRGIDG